MRPYRYQSSTSEKDRGKAFGVGKKNRGNKKLLPLLLFEFNFDAMCLP